MKRQVFFIHIQYDVCAVVKSTPHCYGNAKTKQIFFRPLGIIKYILLYAIREKHVW